MSLTRLSIHIRSTRIYICMLSKLYGKEHKCDMNNGLGLILSPRLLHQDPLSHSVFVSKLQKHVLLQRNVPVIFTLLLLLSRHVLPKGSPNRRCHNWGQSQILPVAFDSKSALDSKKARRKRLATLGSLLPSWSNSWNCKPPVSWLPLCKRSLAWACTLARRCGKHCLSLYIDLWLVEEDLETQKEQKSQGSNFYSSICGVASLGRKKS